MHTLLLHYLAIAWWPFGFLLVFLGMFIEGDIIIFISAFFAHEGFLPLAGLLLASFTGTITGDILWYFGGKKLGCSSFICRLINKFTRPLDRHLIKSPFRTIFISKFSYGVHHGILTRAGMLGISFKKYLKYDIVSSAIWVSIITALGYGSGAYFSLFKRYLRFAEIAILLGVIIFLFAWHYVKKFLKKKL